MTAATRERPESVSLGDHRTCRKCTGEMVLYRSGPHPRRSNYEVQRFECRDCRAQFARTALAAT